MFSNLKLGFLGAGKMGQAIAKGLLTRHARLQIFAYDAYPVTFADAPLNQIEFLESARALEEKADLILLCTKPQDMSTALRDLQGDKKYISIAAGLALDSLQEMFTKSTEVQISRVMPNISALIAESVSGVFCPNRELRDLTLSIFNEIGFAVELPKEDLMHAVTAVSGSGPAFVFAFIQALAEGGVQSGLPYDTALQLAAHTLRGASSLLIESGEHPGSLRNKVTSPAGTTIAGLKELELGAFGGTVMEAVEATARRSRELGRPAAKTEKKQ